jgi:S1-C subfamily serine protease
LYGFTISYNAKQYYASAVDADTGGLYVGDELSTARAYDTIRLSTQAASHTADTSSVRLSYYPHDTALISAADVEQHYITDAQSKDAKLTRVTTSLKSIHGVNFQRTEWSRIVAAGKLTLTTTFVTYAANINGHPFTVIVYQGTNSATVADTFMNAMTFSDNVTAVTLTPTSAVIEKHSLAERLLDTVLGIQTANAAAPNYTASERVSATYGPAVVKIYNVYCADLTLDGSVIYKDYVAGGTGSGFIVSGDGYVATNGHVVVNDAREETIYLAISLSNQGNTQLLSYLVGLTGLQQSDIAGQTQSEMETTIVKALYNIDKSHFAFSNLQTNLLVGLSDKQVDIDELVSMTKNRQAYPEQDTIKKATIIRYDYGGEILPEVTKEFKNSDVALIKLSSGSDYPMVKIGSMLSAAQGSDLNIMGFPSTGSSSNGLVSKTVTSATLTTGKVSALKKDTDGRSMIETDTEIGHGNSGGPAFTDDGDVIGIATYTSDTGEAGDGVLNYIRDIADFTALADKESVGYETVSQTQSTWNKAINLFYEAHYKAAIPVFEQVQALYPNHPQVAAMISSSEKHIANGDNIDEFPLVPVIVAAAIALVGAVVAMIFIVRHKKRHAAYVHGVSTGQIQPMTKGMPAQSVVVPQSASFHPLSQPIASTTPTPSEPTGPVVQPPVEVPTTLTIPQPTPPADNSSTPQWPSQQ